MYNRQTGIATSYYLRRVYHHQKLTDEASVLCSEGTDCFVPLDDAESAGRTVARLEPSCERFGEDADPRGALGCERLW